MRKGVLSVAAATSLIAAIIAPSQFSWHESTWEWAPAEGEVAGYQVKVRGKAEGFEYLRGNLSEIKTIMDPNPRIVIRAKGCIRIRVRAVDINGNPDTTKKTNGWSQWSEKYCPSLLPWG